MEISEILGVVYFLLTLGGAVGASVLGYFEAKKTEPKLDFSYGSFFSSLLRAMPVTIPAAFVLARAGTGVEVVLAGIFTSLVAGAGLDVVIKRAWRTTQS